MRTKVFFTFIFKAFVLYHILVSASLAANSISAAPPGFEDLLEPQTTQVDVYYGGAYLISTLATFTPSDIRFANALTIVNKIPDILDKEKIIQILQQDMPTHSEQVCLKRNQTNCGSLKPLIVDVIFDENNFRVDIFIAPDLLAIRSASKNKYLPPSSSGLSLLNVLGATMTGQQAQSKNYNLSNSTTLAYRETRLLAISNFTKQEDFTLDTLALQREFNGRHYQAGVFRSSPGSMVFIREADFMGFSLASSLDTRKDLDQSSGNSLQFFLDSRSRVDILKDNRLISSGLYEAGNQIIDTSSLPGGAYDITLRIRDNFGKVREETRFYAKTNLLPPKDQTLFFFDVGELVSKTPGSAIATRNGSKLLRTGISKRIFKDFGGDLGMVYLDKKSLLETGLFKLGRVYDTRLNLAFGSQQSRGISLNTNIRLGRTSVSSNLRKTWSQTSTSAIGAAITQGSLNLSLPFRRSSLSLSARYNKRGIAIEKNFGLRYEFPSYRFSKRSLFSDLQLSNNNGNWQVLLGARISQQGTNWQSEFRSQYFYDNINDLPSDSGLLNNLTTSWRDGDRYLSDIGLTFRAVNERTDNSSELELEYASDLGRAKFDVAYSQQRDKTNYGASYYTSFLANKDTISFGGKSQARSAIVLDIEGDVDDAFFDIEVNGLIKDSAKIGKKTILSLAPYQSYEVRLSPRGNSLLEFGGKSKSATLYPGNVVSFNWKTTRVLVAFGQIIDSKGRPITNALIKGVIGLATTDDFGLFQAEINSSTREFLVKTRTSECKVSLPEFSDIHTIVTLGKLNCI